MLRLFDSPAFAAALLLGVLALAGCGDKSSGTKSPAAEGTLNAQAERVEWRAGAAGAWSVVEASRSVSGEDSVRTDASGRARLTFYSGAEVDILPGTELAVRELSQAGDGTTVVTLEQLTGQTLHRVDRLANMQSRYELDTPVVHLVVRGTEFGVGVAADGATRLDVQAGTVRAQVKATGQTYDVNPGEALDVDARSNTAGPRPIRAPAQTPTPTPRATPLPTRTSAPPRTPTPTIGAILPPARRATSTPAGR